MAKFHSLTPPMGSLQERQAPEMFHVELELALPQDTFLPADDIQAEVWTNIIHKLNPDGPEVWAPVPMKLSHVIPGQSIAVFSARLQPTGRGDFGLTARWKSYGNLQDDWEWAPPSVDTTPSGGKEPKSKDVNVSVKIPRDISGISSWAMGPQSVMVWGKEGPRVNGANLGGPGLYLGNHAAATRARIAGYEAVLSLTGGVLDFDEKIPATDKDLNKQIWEEQARAQLRPYSPMSRTSSVSSHHSGRNGNGEGGPESVERRNQSQSKRLSVVEFMRENEPDGDRWDLDKILAGVVDEPEEGPRLARKNSVTEMMVKPPTTSKRAMSRSTISATPIGEDEQDQEQSGKQGAPPKPAATAETAPAPAPAPNRSQAKGEGPSGPGPTSQGKKAASTTVTDAAASSLATPPASGQETGKKKRKGRKDSDATKTTAPSAVSEDSKDAATIKTTGSTSLTTPDLVSPMITSLDINSAPDAHSHGALRSPTLSYSAAASKGLTNVATDAPKKDEQSESPPSSARIISGISKSSLGGSTTNPFADDPRILQPQLSPQPQQQDPDSAQPKQPFEHKVISMPPGAQSTISDAALKEAIEFLTTQIGQGKKVLVHCRDGNGRSGSVAIAYIASQQDRNGQPSHYNEALEEIWKWKCDVYPHKGLKQSLERLGW